MDNTFLAAPNRRWLWASTVAAVVTLTAIGLVIRHTGPPTAEPPPPAIPAVTQTGSPSPAATFPSPIGSAAPIAPLLRLVAGSRTVGGVRVGYPHTQAGAVSAAIEYVTQATSNLDLQRAVTIGETITDGSYGPSDVFAEGPMSIRKALGVATTGPVPAGASVVTSPAAYQVRDASRDSVTVLVLAYLTVRSQNSGIRSQVAVFPIQLVWSDGDWKDTKRADSAPDYAQLRTQPGTPEAAAAGWQEFLQ